MKNDKQLEQVNLRLKQLVAIKVLESINQGYNLFYDFDLAHADPDEGIDGLSEACDRERIENDEAVERYQREFKEATEALDKLNKRGKKR